MKKIIGITILIYIFSFITGTVLFISLFKTGLFTNFDVFFYRGIILLFTSCLFTTLILLLIKRKWFQDIFTYRDIILALVLIFSFNLLFFTHIPVTANRSLSVFILGYLNHYSERALTKQEISQEFLKKYLEENQGIEKRLHEQLVSKNIVQVDNGYQISNQGELLIKFYLIIADLFGLDKKNLTP